MPRTYYSKRIGDANAICDVCGFKFKTHQLKLRWDGLWTCHADWEPRHPQDFLRARKESNNLPVVKPRPPDVFVPNNYTGVPTDYFVFRDDIGTKSQWYRQLTDTAILSEQVSTALASFRVATDTLKFVEQTQTSMGIAREVIDTLKLSETITTTSERIRAYGFALNTAPLNTFLLG